MRNVLLSGAAALVLAAGGAWWLTSSPSTSQAPGSVDLLGAANAQDSGAEIDTSSIVEMTLGNANAPVTIIEYASFTCPHCASFHKDQFKQLKAEYIDSDRVHFIYRDVFFDRYGLWASMVARCGGQERFFGISDMLYDQQRDWASGNDPAVIADNLRKIGKLAGLSQDQLNSCLSDADKAQALVAWYQENAEADGVNSTPTIVINGEKHTNMSYAEMKGIIDGLLPE